MAKRVLERIKALLKAEKLRSYSRVKIAAGAWTRVEQLHALFMRECGPQSIDSPP